MAAACSAIWRGCRRRGIRVMGVVYGGGRGGGAYMPGLSDVVIMVRGRSRAFLAGPPLLAAATGERATEEELGGADMHTTLSGLGEYLGQDDRHATGPARGPPAAPGWGGGEGGGGEDGQAMGVARDLLAAAGGGRQRQAPAHGAEPLLPADDLLALMPEDLRQPVDMREVIARLVDGSELLEFKARHGAATVCAQARIAGHPVGLVSNNGPIDVAGANKATHFIQWMCQLGQPLIYLQNTTGYMVGKDSEQGGMIKHGSKMLQAVTQATVPQLTYSAAPSFGAGNYGMCGRGFAPRFLFSWPGAKTAVMGGEQAARTMQIVTDAALARKGRVPDAAQSQARFEQIVARFETQADALYTSGLLLDDGVIDPRDTRAVLALCLSTIAEGAARTLRPLQFGVARM